MKRRILVKEVVNLPPKETMTFSFNELVGFKLFKSYIDIQDDYLLDNENDCIYARPISKFT